MSVIICLTIDEIQSSFRSKVHIILRTELQNWAFLLTIWVESFTHWVWHFCQETSNNPSKVQRIWQRNFRMFQIQEFLQLYECFSKREWGDSVVSEIKGWEDAFYKFLSLLFNHGLAYCDFEYHDMTLIHWELLHDPFVHGSHHLCPQQTDRFHKYATRLKKSDESLKTRSFFSTGVSVTHT